MSREEGGGGKGGKKEKSWDGRLKGTALQEPSSSCI